MTHDTDLRGTGEILRQGQFDLSQALTDLQGPEGAEIAWSEGARNVLETLIADAKRSVQVAMRSLARLGVTAPHGAAVRDVLIKVLESAHAPEKPKPTPLPDGVARGRAELGDDDKTPELGTEVVNPIEVDATVDADRKATRPLGGKHHAQGPWTQERKPRGGS